MRPLLIGFTTKLGKGSHMIHCKKKGDCKFAFEHRGDPPHDAGKCAHGHRTVQQK